MWFEEAVFYQIYPLGFCGAPFENDGKPESRILKVLDWIGETFAPGEVLVSLMRQYTPMGGLPAPLDRRVSDEEYDAVLSWMYLNDLEGFTQEADAAVAQTVEIVGGIPACQQIVVVNADGLGS